MEPYDDEAITSTTTIYSEPAEAPDDKQAAESPQPNMTPPRQPLGFAGLAAGGRDRTRVAVRSPRQLDSTYG